MELRRTIVNGEAGLEAPGIERVSVPQEVLDMFPVYTYVGKNQTSQDGASPAGPQVDHTSHTTPAVNDEADSVAPPSQQPPTDAPPIVPQTPIQAIDQPACPICLDDFISDHTAVRELPCGYIYHPGCIDLYLKKCSSRCPLCKDEVLPIGYRPHAVVRRDRQARHRRETELGGNNREASFLSAIVQSIVAGFSPFYSATGHEALRWEVAGGLQETVVLPAATPAPQAAIEDTLEFVLQVAMPRPPGVDRAEWIMQRTTALAGERRVADGLDRDREERSSWWRRVVRTVFPRL